MSFAPLNPHRDTLDPVTPRHRFNPRKKLILEPLTLTGPRRAVGHDHELITIDRGRTGVLGQVRPDDLAPPAKDRIEYIDGGRSHGSQESIEGAIDPLGTTIFA